MSQALLQRVLAGEQEAQVQFGEARHCAVIDWRDGPREIVDVVAAFLPDGFLILGALSGDSCEFVVPGRKPVCFHLSRRAKQENLIFAINEAIKPDYEIRQYRPNDGDGYSLFVAPQAVWSGLENADPEAIERLFLNAQRLAEYWSKGYMARLFSKP